MAAFGELGVIPQLCQPISAMGLELPTAIQNEAIPAILSGGDVLITVETGAAKTAAFCLPVSQIVWEKRKDSLYPKSNVKKTPTPTLKLNQSDRHSGLEIDGTGLACESRTPILWVGCRATASVHSKGKYYYEATIARYGLCRVGWSTSSAMLELGMDNKSFGSGATGMKSNNHNFEVYGRSFSKDDVIGCFLDLDNLQIWWSVNGQEFPIAYCLQPQFADPLNALHPAVLVQNTSLIINFGATPFRFPPDPAKGFVAIASASESCLRWRPAELRAARAAAYSKTNVKTEAPTLKLNHADRDPSLLIDGAGLACESRTPRHWFGCRATAAVHSKGKYYYEATITRYELCRVGWSTSSAVLKLGLDDKSFGFGGTGRKSHKNTFEMYGRSFSKNDVVGCFLDLDNLQIWWSVNGQEFPIAHRLEPQFADPMNALHPAVLLRNSSLRINFGATPFRFPPDPAKGFVAIASASESCLRWRSIESRTADVTALPKAPLGLILEPTRELVEQTHNNLIKFAKVLQDPPLRCLSVAADVSMPVIISELRKGVDIVTGTLGRVVDLIELGELSLASLKLIVMDEADQILSNSDTAVLVARLYSQVPVTTSDGSRLQTIVCSTTPRSMDVKNFADRHMHSPQWVDLKGMDTFSETVHHVVGYYVCYTL